MMLNEFLEFESYVTAPETDKPRIQPYLLTESFKEEPPALNGIEQILTVIARAFIFENMDVKNYDESELIDEQLVSAAIEVLHRWCGFDDSEQRKKTENPLIKEWLKKYPEAEGWLKRYWLHQFDEKHAKKKRKPDKQKLWETLQGQWNKKFNSLYDYRFKQISYGNVIANALETGPLRNRYLVIKRDENQKEEKGKKRFDYLFEAKGNPQETTKMKFIKNIAAYLILQELHPENQTEVLLKRIQLLQWYGRDDAKGEKKIWFLEEFSWEGKPIFYHHSPQMDYIKFSVDANYLAEHDIRLIEERDIAKYKDTHWILEDRGHGLKNCWDMK